MFQKWSNKIFPIVNFVVSHNGHVGRGGGGPEGVTPPLLLQSTAILILPWPSVVQQTTPGVVTDSTGARTGTRVARSTPARHFARMAKCRFVALMMGTSSGSLHRVASDAAASLTNCTAHERVEGHCPPLPRHSPNRCQPSCNRQIRHPALYGSAAAPGRAPPLRHHFRPFRARLPPPMPQ